MLQQVGPTQPDFDNLTRLAIGQDADENSSKFKQVRSVIQMAYEMGLGNYQRQGLYPWQPVPEITWRSETPGPYGQTDERDEQRKRIAEEGTLFCSSYQEMPPAFDKTFQKKFGEILA